MKNLKKRNTLMSSLQQVWKTARRNWNLLTNTLPQNIFNICRKALFSLNNNKNLARWKIRDSRIQIHFLYNCTSAINDGGFKWNHDSIFKTILFYLTTTNEYDVFAAVEGHKSSAVLFNSSIPDIGVIIELTVCFETNLFS